MKALNISGRFGSFGSILIDDEDYEKVSLRRWYGKYSGSKNVLYVHTDIYTKGKRKTVRLHRFLLNPPDNMEVDHIDGNGLNNQRSNLRIVTRSINQRNRGKNKNNTSGFKGISWHVPSGKWRARVYRNHKEIGLGFYDSIDDAKNVYDEYIKNENSSCK